MKRAGIIGIGFWAPSTVRKNDAWGEDYIRGFREHREARRQSDFTDHTGRDSKRAHDAIFAKYALPHEDDPFKGTLERRVADSNEPASTGDAIAAGRAVADAGIDPRSIDLVLASALPQDKLCPSNAPAVAAAIGSHGAASVGVESYCSSPVAQFDFAAALVETGRAKHVLCVQSHQIGRINDLRLPASPIFGDASGAFIVGEVPEGYGVIASVRGGDPSLRNGVALSFPENPTATWWQGNTGPIVPGSDDPSAAKVVGRNLLRYPIEMLKSLCDAGSVSPDVLAAVIMIQPTCWFQAAIADALSLPVARFPSTHARFAHVGGAAIPLNLLEAKKTGLLHDGALVALYGHGAGFTTYGALLRWNRA